MSVTGKSSLSLRKQDVREQKNLAIGFKKTMFAHKATAGDTGIDLGALVAPPEMTGFVNPTSQEILAAQIYFYRKNLTLISSLRGILMDYLSYNVATSSRINFVGFTAADGEVFTGIIDYNARNGIQVVDAAPLVASGTLSAGLTDFNTGQVFEINKYSSQQAGAVLVYRNGVQQFRNSNNSSVTLDGNYYEVNNGSGLGSIIRFNVAAVGPGDNILVVSNGLLVYNPDGSALQRIESLAGQIDAIVPTVAALAGVPETNFQGTPNYQDLKTFGDDVQNMKQYVGENLSALRQYNLTVTGTNAWVTDRAIGIPYMTLDGAWRLRINIAGTHSSATTTVLTITGVVFKPFAGVNRQSVSANDDSGGSAPSNNFVTGGTNTLSINFALANTANTISGDVELDAKPSFVP